MGTIKPLTLDRILDFYNEYPVEKEKVPVKTEEVPGYIAYVLLQQPLKYHHFYGFERFQKRCYPKLSITRPKLNAAVVFLSSSGLIKPTEPTDDNQIEKTRFSRIKLTYVLEQLSTLETLANYWTWSHGRGFE